MSTIEIDRPTREAIVRIATENPTPPRFPTEQADSARELIYSMSAHFLRATAQQVLSTERALDQLERAMESATPTKELLVDVLALMDTLQVALRTAFESAEKGRSISRAENLEVVTSVARRLFDRSEALRWEILERQADADLKDGCYSDFSSLDDAISFLRS